MQLKSKHLSAEENVEERQNFENQKPKNANTPVEQSILTTILSRFALIVFSFVCAFSLFVLVFANEVFKWRKTFLFVFD